MLRDPLFIGVAAEARAPQIVRPSQSNLSPPEPRSLRRAVWVCRKLGELSGGLRLLPNAIAALVYVLYGAELAPL